ncbi:MAG: MATE family efflux transporter, partial [Pseudomonadota bacterium]
PIFAVMGASDELMPLIHDYMDIWLPTSVLLVAIITANAILRACGNTRTPSILLAAAGLINAALDPLFIFGLGPVPAMGIAGAAVATLISWVMGFGYLAWLLTCRLKLVDLSLPSMTVFRQSGGEMLRIGIPASGANMLTPLAAGVMTALIAGYGDTAVAAFGVGSRIESIASLLILSLSMTLPPFVSQNYGANRLHRVEKAYRLCIRFVLLAQLVIYGVLVLSMPWIVSLFTDDPEVASVLRLFIWILPLGYGLQGVIILGNSALNALHQPMVALYLSMARFFVFYVPLAWIGSLLFGLPGFFGGALAGNLLMAIVSRLTFRKVVDEACRHCPEEDERAAPESEQAPQPPPP